MPQLSPGSAFGPFVIEGFIADGGIGEVYAASHSVYGHAAALKVLHERFATDPRWHKRFGEEGLLGLQLKHPHVLSARELVEHEDRVAIVMDLVSGGQTLLKVVDRDWPTGLSIGQALTVFLRIVSGVEYLHDRGLVHGDLKPENLLIEGRLREPPTWQPKVSDFGTLALIADPVEIDGRPAVVASPRYASPEHLRGVDHLIPGSDVYALGLILHYLLSGQHASGARTIREASVQVGRPISLVYVVDQPDPLLSILERATHPDPDRRYPNCRELALAVRDVLDELGLGLQLDDLQADLATEVVEERAQAQRALYGADQPTAEVTLGEPESGDDGDEPQEGRPEEPDAPVALEEPSDDPDSGETPTEPPDLPADDPETAETPVVRATPAPAVHVPRLAPPSLSIPILPPAPPEEPSFETIEPREDISDSPTEPVGARVVIRAGTEPRPPMRAVANPGATHEEPSGSDPHPSPTTPAAAESPAPERPVPTPPVPTPPSAGRSIAILIGVGAALGLLTVLGLWLAGYWP